MIEEFGHKTYADMVADFHKHFGITEPQPWTQDLIQYRQKFLSEEYREILRAYLQNDKEQVLDGLVDLTYVSIGTAYLHGFNFDEAFKRVHSANMKKIKARTADESKRGHILDIVKPEGWQPPYLKDLV